MNRYSVVKNKDGRYHIMDNYTKSIYGAFRTEEEAHASLLGFNNNYNNEKRELAKCGLMMAD